MECREWKRRSPKNYPYTEGGRRKELAKAAKKQRSEGCREEQIERDP